MFNPAKRTIFGLVSAAAERISATDTDKCVCGDTYAEHQPQRISAWLGPSSEHYRTMPTYVRRQCTVCDCSIYEHDNGGV